MRRQVDYALNLAVP